MIYNDVTVGKIKLLHNGEMKLLEVNGTKVLLYRKDDKYYATGAVCTHYGGPLEEGFLDGDNIVCPWHQSCFNIKNGSRVEPPALDPVLSYEVFLKGEKIIIKLPGESEAVPTIKSGLSDTTDVRNFLIIGGGAAGCMAAITLREKGFMGNVTIISQENRKPYDRPNLSKDFLEGNAKSELMPLRSDDFYKENRIEFLLNQHVSEIDTFRKEIFLNDGRLINYDKLLVASGGSPNKLNIPGNDLKNIFYLRSFDDCLNIIEAAKTAKHITVIGGSFIGMESAISLKTLSGLPVTVIFQQEIPFEKIFGKEIGNLILKLYKNKGIEFSSGTKPSAFHGNDSVNNIVLENGKEIKTDLVVIGIGVSPATGFINDIPMEKDGSLKTDQYLMVKDNVFAAGDIVSFPYPQTGNLTRIEHWRTALQQGKTAALNMLGFNEPFDEIPFFWTKQDQLNLVYVGHSHRWDEIIYDGNVSETDMSFIAYYVSNHKIVAAAGNYRDKEMAEINHLMKTNNMPDPEKLKASIKKKRIKN
jgi:NADPH-dependent 2,4-dienoyl-CoA reductase/sulfur reductase-like enzyme/nitrite reductase/ring-hydroxylating ferredoxin subunit